MKILYVTSSLPYGATEVFAIPEVLELLRRGHDVRLVPSTRYNEQVHSDARPLLARTDFEPLLSRTVLQAALPGFAQAPGHTTGALARSLRGQNRMVLKRNLGSFPKALWLGRFARRWGAEHIHAYWASGAASLAMVAGAASGVPWSFTAHRWDIAQPNALRAKVESARFVRFISQDGFELARPVAGPTLPEKARLIRMGVPLSDRPLERTAPPPGVALRLVCTGSLIARKGQRFLLEALGQLRDEGVRVHVSFAGQGETKPDLEAQARDLNISEQVEFMGNVDHARLLDFYSEGRFDAFTLPSLHEGISVALIEAMSRGLPVIATDVGGTRELLTDGTGQLIPAEDVSSIVEAVKTLVRDDAGRFRQAQLGRERVMAEYDIVGVVDALEANFLEHKKS